MEGASPATGRNPNPSSQTHLPTQTAGGTGRHTVQLFFIELLENRDYKEDSEDDKI